MLARQRFDYSWEIPPTQKSYRRAFAWPRCGARWVPTRWWRKKKGGRNLWAIATKEYMELVTVISHVSSRASAVSFRHVSWNHEFDSRPSLPPRGCVSSGVCVSRVGREPGNRARYPEREMEIVGIPLGIFFFRGFYTCSANAVSWRGARCSVKFLRRFFGGGRGEGSECARNLKFVIY